MVDGTGVVSVVALAVCVYEFDGKLYEEAVKEGMYLFCFWVKITTIFFQNHLIPFKILYSHLLSPRQVFNMFKSDGYVTIVLWLNGGQ